MTEPRKEVKEAVSGISPEMSALHKDIIFEVVGPRCGKIAMECAKFDIIAMLSDEDPLRSIASSHMAFVSLLFKRGIIVFKEVDKPVEGGAS